MKTLRELAGGELLRCTSDLVKEERRITSLLLEHLREIERRMLFAEMGYSSLFEFCVKHLGYSESSANRRIQSMRLCRDVPEAKESLESGKLSLSNAAKLQSVFRMAPEVDKKAVLSQVENSSQRECEQKLLQILPEIAPQALGHTEKVRALSNQKMELKLVVSPELMGKLDRLKELLSHQTDSYLELIERLADQELKRQEKKKGLDQPSASDQNISVHSAAKRTQKLPSGIRVHIPNAIQREVWRRARGQCQYANCSSRHRLQIDHITPLALGGSNEIQNLRLLCRTHNQQQALRKLGSRAMEPFLRATQRPSSR